LGRKSSFDKEHVRPLKSYAQSAINRYTPPAVRNTSFPLLGNIVKFSWIHFNGSVT